MSASASAACCKSASDQGDDSLPEPDYDHLDISFASMKDGDDDDDLKKGIKGSMPVQQQYIVGTLIVRVVAARDLESVQKGGFGILSSPSRAGRSRGTANPYASVKFCGQTQRTTEVYDTVNPTWPRGETMFMDVSRPVSQVTYRSEQESDVEVAPVAAAAAAAPPVVESPEPFARPILTLAMFHAMPNNAERYPSKKKGQLIGDSDEPFLGMTSMDVTPLLTGKVVTMDKWLPLVGTNKDMPRGTVRIVCEYEASDPPPRPGDLVRFSRFCDAADLYPVPVCEAHRVEEVEGDNVLVTYATPEGWLCTFQAHRFMLICEERHQGAVEICQEELASLAERLGKSPLVHTVTESVVRVPDEGLVSVGVDAVRGGASLLERWLKGGLGTATQDLVYATNWDGRFTTAPSTSEASVEPPPSNNDPPPENIGRLKVPDDEDDDESEAGDALPGMPCCPITGEPMVNPVVAADGHTYERAAIARWLQTSDKSPLTGSYLAHKELVPNYVLLSSLQEADSKRKAEN